MQLKLLLATALAAVTIASVPVAAQSLTPMRNEGNTPSGMKAFRLLVGNPYPKRMVFTIVPMELGFEIPAADAKVNFPQIALAPGVTRQVIVTFRIDPAIKERTIGVCVQPREIEGTVLPRVCGTYIGRMLG